MDRRHAGRALTLVERPSGDWGAPARRLEDRLDRGDLGGRVHRGGWEGRRVGRWVGHLVGSLVGPQVDPRVGRQVDPRVGRQVDPRLGRRGLVGRRGLLGRRVDPRVGRRGPLVGQGSRGVTIDPRCTMSAAVAAAAANTVHRLRSSSNYSSSNRISSNRISSSSSSSSSNRISSSSSSSSNRISSSSSSSSRNRGDTCRGGQGAEVLFLLHLRLLNMYHLLPGSTEGVHRRTSRGRRPPAAGMTLCQGLAVAVVAV